MDREQRELDELYMLGCLALAAKGAGSVSPNPLVGALLTKGGKVIARGFHKQYGGPHAEVNALQAAGPSARGATLYVNLEPCGHFGKTPPCADRIIASKIRRVVVGMRDPNPLVAGKGIRKLRQAGIAVRESVLRDECETLNEKFIKYITTKLPFVAVKIAQTLDGRIAERRDQQVWISNSESRALVHRLRAHYDAVLVGAGTIRSDNPLLTVRYVPGRNPVRVILDGRLTSIPSAQVFTTARSVRTIVMTSIDYGRKRSAVKDKLLRKGVEVVEVEGGRAGQIDAGTIVSVLGAMKIGSVLVEGGADIFRQFLAPNVADKVYLFVAPAIFGHGLSVFGEQQRGEPLRLVNVSSRNIRGDTLIEGYLNKIDNRKNISCLPELLRP